MGGSPRDLRAWVKTVIVIAKSGLGQESDRHCQMREGQTPEGQLPEGQTPEGQMPEGM